MSLVETVAARLRAQVPSRAVFEHGVPNGVLPAAYLLVRAAVTGESGERMPETVDHETWTVYVLSVARHADPHVAARTANAGMQFARPALRGFRPDGPWRLRYETGTSAFRDESTADTHFTAAAQYSVRVNI